MGDLLDPNAPTTSYSLSDLGKRTGGARSSSPLGSAGGYRLSDLGAGSGSDGPVPTYGGTDLLAGAAGNTNPTAGKPSNGGGILGWLGRAASGAVRAVQGVPAGVSQLGHDVGTAGARGLENIANDVAFAATLGHEGGYDTRHLGGAQETPNFSHAGSALGALIDTHPGAMADAIRGYPSLEGARAGLVRSGMEVAHPTQLVHNYSTDPVGSLLNDAANVAIVGGPVASGALHGASVVADSAKLARAAEIADAASHAAGQVAASPLRPFVNAGGILGDLAAKTAAGQAIADRAGAAVDAVKNSPRFQAMAARNTVDPLYTEHMLIDRGEKIGALENTIDPKALTQDPHEQAAGVLLAQHAFGGVDESGQPVAARFAAALEHPAARVAFDASWNAKGDGLPAEFRPSADAAHLAMKAELGQLPADQLARIQAVADALRSQDQTRTALEQTGYGRTGTMGPLSPENLVPKPRMGTVDKMTAKEQAVADRTANAADVLRGRASRLADAATREEQVARGNTGLGSVASQAVDAHLAAERAMEAAAKGADATGRIMGAGINPDDIGRGPSTLDQILGRPGPSEPPSVMQAMLDARARIRAAAEQDAAAKAADQERVTPRDLTLPVRPGLESLTPAERVLYRSDEATAQATAKDQALGQAKDKAFDTIAGRGKAAGTAEGVRTGQAQLADRLARVAENRAAKAADRLEAARAAATDSVQAAPAKYRPALQHTADFLGSLRDEAVKAKAVGDPGSAAQLEQMAKDLAPLSKLDRFRGVGAEGQPAHVIGANNAAVDASVRDRSSVSNSRAAIERQTGSARQRVGNATAYTVEGQKALELSRIQEQARNEYAKALDRQVATTADKVLGAEHGLKGTDLFTAMRAQGYEPWNPSGALTDKVNANLVTDKTRWLPRPVFDEVQRTASGLPKPGLAGRTLDAVTRAVYKNPLQMSPGYLLKRTVGNAALMAANDMSPADIVRAGAEAIRAMKDGTDPRALRGSLIGDSNQSRFTNIVTKPAATIDRFTRTALYLDKLGKGAEPAEALRMANQALGSFNTLSPFERDVVRRVFPVYSWAKTVAATAAKLGADHPASVIWALHLGDMATKDGWKKPSSFEQQLNPLSLFTIDPGSLVNPVLRGAFGVARGDNVTNGKPVSRPPTMPQTGSLIGHASPGQIAYFLGKQTPLGKLIEQSPLSGLDQNAARFDTGDLRLVHGHTLPAYVPASKTPVGTFGPEFRTFLGVPADPKVNAQGQTAKTKTLARTNRTAATYLRQVAALRAKGER